VSVGIASRGAIQNGEMGLEWDVHGAGVPAMIYLCAYCWAYCRPADISILATKQFPCNCCPDHKLAQPEITHGVTTGLPGAD
jgi:hypothetical protein